MATLRFLPRGNDLAAFGFIGDANVNDNQYHWSIYDVFDIFRDWPFHAETPEEDNAVWSHCCLPTGSELASFGFVPEEDILIEGVDNAAVDQASWSFLPKDSDLTLFGFVDNNVLLPGDDLDAENPAVPDDTLMDWSFHAEIPEEDNAVWSHSCLSTGSELASFGFVPEADILIEGVDNAAVDQASWSFLPKDSDLTLFGFVDNNVLLPGDDLDAENPAVPDDTLMDWSFHAETPEEDNAVWSHSCLPTGSELASFGFVPEEDIPNINAPPCRVVESEDDLIEGVDNAAEDHASWSFWPRDSDLALFGFVDNNVLLPDDDLDAANPAVPDEEQENSKSNVAACGVADKLKDQLVQDIDDPVEAAALLAVLDSVDDIYGHLKLSEQLCHINDYMSYQPEMTTEMRAILADWVIQIHHKYKLRPEALYLSLYIIDRYLSMEIVPATQLQLVGVSAMLIANKYEERKGPSVDHFVCFADGDCPKEEILEMEKRILSKLKWKLTVPTPYAFLVKFCKAAQFDKQMEHLVFFFAELGLMEYSMTKYPPSMFAASAVYAAQCTLKKNSLWNEAFTGFCESQLLDCTRILVNAHSVAARRDLKIVYNKYSSKEFGGVALLPPATKLIKR